MSREQFLAELLAERFGPLPVERTNPVRVTEPSPNLLAALEVGQEMADEPAADGDLRPWESRRAWAEELFDRLAA
jgi:hypothetical protein